MITATYQLSDPTHRTEYFMLSLQAFRLISHNLFDRKSQPNISGMFLTCPELPKQFSTIAIRLALASLLTATIKINSIKLRHYRTLTSKESERTHNDSDQVIVVQSQKLHFSDNINDTLSLLNKTNPT